MHWCNKCCEHYDEDGFKVLEITKGKRGKYYPYRDTMDSEHYTYTEVILECLKCGEKTKTEEDEHFEMSKTRMEKYGYRGSHYGT